MKELEERLIAKSGLACEYGYNLQVIPLVDTIQICNHYLLDKFRWRDAKVEQPESFIAVLIEADFIGTSYMAEITTIGTWQKDHWTTDRHQDLGCEEIIVNKWTEIPNSEDHERR